MNIDDYLRLTTSSNDSIGHLRDEALENYKELDVDKLTSSMYYEQLFLRIEDNGEIVGHEGRHRALPMKEQGVKTIPVLLYNFDGKYTEKIPIASILA